MKLLVLLTSFIFSFSILEAKDNPKDPHDDDLKGKNFEVEELKLRNLRNNMVIVFLGIVIGGFIVF